MLWQSEAFIWSWGSFGVMGLDEYLEVNGPLSLLRLQLRYLGTE
jgi:hypothetical protein